MVDGAIKNSYGPFMNDGLTHKEANTELVFGEDGKIYVETTTTVAKNDELLLAYGSSFWLEPSKWKQLAESTKQAVLRYYKLSTPSI